MIKTILMSLALAGGAAACHHNKPAVAPNEGTGFNGTNASPGQPVCNNATETGKAGNPGCEPDQKSDSATNTNADGNAGANGTPAH